MTTAQNLHEVITEETERHRNFYQLEINRELSRSEIKLLESVIGNVLNNKGKEEY